jgi:hypothetical protein
LLSVAGAVLNLGLNDAVVAELEVEEYARQKADRKQETEIKSDVNDSEHPTSAVNTYNSVMNDDSASGQGYEGTWVLELYRRFLANFGTVVLGVDAELYASLLAAELTREGVEDEVFLSRSGLQRLVHEFKVRERDRERLIGWWVGWLAGCIPDFRMNFSLCAAC